VMGAFWRFGGEEARRVIGQGRVTCDATNNPVSGYSFPFCLWLLFECGFEGRFIVDDLRPGLQSPPRRPGVYREEESRCGGFATPSPLSSPAVAQSLCPSKEIGHFIWAAAM
jgi:hypothetical protein